MSEFRNLSSAGLLEAWSEGAELVVIQGVSGSINGWVQSVARGKTLESEGGFLGDSGGLLILRKSDIANNTTLSGKTVTLSDGSIYRISSVIATALTLSCQLVSLAR
jgi:hypothetical protein